MVRRKLTTAHRNIRGSANKAVRERRKKASLISKGDKNVNYSNSYASSTRSNQVCISQEILNVLTHKKILVIKKELEIFF